MKIDYHRLAFVPVVGLAGSGKSALLEQLAATGKQVLSLEEVAGVSGVCLAGLFGDAVVGQEELDVRLKVILAECDPAKPIYVEWKKVEVTGYALPEALITAVRTGPAIFVDTPLAQRIAALLEKYPAWHSRLDTFLKRVADNGLDRNVLAMLERAASISVSRFVEVLLVEHLDPLYMNEIQHFQLSSAIGDRAEARFA